MKNPSKQKLSFIETRPRQEIIINNHKPKSFLSLVEHSNTDSAWFRKSKNHCEVKPRARRPGLGILSWIQWLWRLTRGFSRTSPLQEIIKNNHKPKAFLSLVQHSHTDSAWFKKSKKSLWRETQGLETRPGIRDMRVHRALDGSRRFSGASRKL